jgi:hypothetical protein
VSYKAIEKQVLVRSAGELITLDVRLEDAEAEMQEITLTVKQRNRGKEIMQKAREKRVFYLDNIHDYSCETYQKISVEREYKAPSVHADSSRNKETASDSLKITKEKPEPDGDKKPVKKVVKKEKTNSIESFSTIYFMKPGKYKEDITAYHDFTEKKPTGHPQSVTFGFTYGEPDIASDQFEGTNSAILDYDPQSSDFNFYQSLINVPEISDKPLQSPLAPTADLSYRFRLESTFFEGDKQIFKISVEPIFKNEGLFEGTIYIEDSSYAIRSVDFKINPFALHTCSEFHIIQNYASLGDGIYLPVRREYTYTMFYNGDKTYGNTQVEHTNYKVNKGLDPKLFGAEVKLYQPDAFDKDTLFWNQKRPFLLKPNEEDYILETDSMNALYASKEYLDSIDRDYNHLKIWNFLLTGIIHRDRYKKYNFYISPLIQQLNPFGIGGYRHMLGGEFTKEFKNHYTLETDELLNYGFANKDLKWRMGAGLTYVPKRFVRTYVQVGDLYTMINSNASFSQVFSRSNYVRSQSVLVSQRMELINGLFGEVSFYYAKQTPLDAMKIEEWSKKLFGGELNTPTDFTPYIKSEIKLQLKYRLGQKYVIKNDKKLIIGSYYPEFTLTYRKGIPGLLGSEVNYDYLEAGFHRELKLARLGYSGLDISAGSFINSRSLRVLEYKYFRGSDEYLFYDPLGSFQLLGYTLSTATGYFRANYIHHFDGWPTDKIPVIRALKIGLAGGAGIMLMQQNNFRHAEIFAGIERKVKIKGQFFRFGAYAVTADNTIEGAKWTWKFGISTYNDYTRKWDY